MSLCQVLLPLVTERAGVARTPVSPAHTPQPSLARPRAHSQGLVSPDAGAAGPWAWQHHRHPCGAGSKSSAARRPSPWILFEAAEMWIREGAAHPLPDRGLLGAGFPETGAGPSARTGPWGCLAYRNPFPALLSVVRPERRGSQGRWLPGERGDGSSCAASTRGSLLDLTSGEGISPHLSQKV